MISFKSFLIEANPDVMYTKEFASKIDKDSFDSLKALDPTESTGQFKYLRWLGKLFLGMEPPERKRFQGEDAEKVRSALELYDKFKKEVESPYNDIGQVKSLSQLYQITSPFEDKKSGKEEKRAIKQDAEKVFEDDEWLILIPETEEAACYYGKGTKWCTAADKNNYFDYYNEQGLLYIIINKQTKEKFQFHFESAQFMDAEDSQIELRDFFSENPSLEEFFADKIKAITTGIVGGMIDMGFDEDTIERDGTRVSGTYYGSDILTQLFDTKHTGGRDLYRYINWFSPTIAEQVESEAGNSGSSLEDFVYRLEDHFDEDTIDTLYNLYRRRGGDAERDDFDAEEANNVLKDELVPFCDWADVQRDIGYIYDWREAFIEIFNGYFDCIQFRMNGEGELNCTFDLDALDDSYLAESIKNQDMENYTSELFDKDAWEKVDNAGYDGGDFDPTSRYEEKMVEILDEYSDELSQPDDDNL